MTRGARKQVYVLYTGSKASRHPKTKFVGTLAGAVTTRQPVAADARTEARRPRAGRADHSLELQLGGLDDFENMCLLEVQVQSSRRPGDRGQDQDVIAAHARGREGRDQGSGITPARPLPNNSLAKS